MSGKTSLLVVTPPFTLARNCLMQEMDAAWGSILFHAGMDIPIILGLFSTAGQPEERGQELTVVTGCSRRSEGGQRTGLFAPDTRDAHTPARSRNVHREPTLPSPETREE